MRHGTVKVRSIIALSLVALLCVATSVRAQGLGGLIRRGTGAVTGRDQPPADQKPGDGPITSQVGDCGPITPELLDRLAKGIQTERTQRTEANAKEASFKPAAQVNACRQQAMTGDPQVMQLMTRGTDNPDTNALMAAMQKNQADLEAYLTQKCGASGANFNKSQAYLDAKRNGAKDAGLSDDCYDKLKELVLGFCNLSAADQQTAVRSGIRAPGVGKGVWVFTAEEAKLFQPRCAQLVPAINATGVF